MAVPKHRTSKQKKRSRRSHLNLSKPNLISCQNCGNKNFTHRVCAKCGFYKGIQVISVKTKK